MEYSPVLEEQFYRNAVAGVPTLHPYWNRPLAEFLLRTPPDLFTHVILHADVPHDKVVSAPALPNWTCRRGRLHAMIPSR